jgi:hypothetical protein
VGGREAYWTPGIRESLPRAYYTLCNGISSATPLYVQYTNFTVMDGFKFTIQVARTYLKFLKEQ